MNFFHSIRFVSGMCLVGALASAAPADEQRQRAASERSKPALGTSAESRLDLNTADVKALEAVPVIGVDGAQAIVAARPFRTIHDLDLVKGISAARLEQIRAVVTVEIVLVPPKLGSPNVNPSQPSTGDEVGDDRVDLNTADLKTLAAIPSIGEETAREIVAARPFERVDDLSRVKDMSAERLELIRTQVTVVPAARATGKADRRPATPVDRR